MAHVGYAVECPQEAMLGDHLLHRYVVAVHHGALHLAHGTAGHQQRQPQGVGAGLRLAHRIRRQSERRDERLRPRDLGGVIVEDGDADGIARDLDKLELGARRFEHIDNQIDAACRRQVDAAGIELAWRDRLAVDGDDLRAEARNVQLQDA